jgi:PHD/YefM family antitoxin component YafN of YafNO toxin-antitoxin module
VLSTKWQIANNAHMHESSITEARGTLSALVDQAHEAPVFLTCRNRRVAAIVDLNQLERLRAAADEVADIRAVDAAWQDAEKRGETPIAWVEVKRDSGPG